MRSELSAVQEEGRTCESRSLLRENTIVKDRKDRLTRLGRRIIVQSEVYEVIIVDRFYFVRIFVILSPVRRYVDIVSIIFDFDSAKDGSICKGMTDLARAVHQKWNAYL